MNKSLLSICIPTYNRGHYLNECLRCLTDQLKDNDYLLKKVEIIISDNASNDDTGKISAEYQNRFSNVRYFRNSVNLGHDANYINSVLKAEGEYGWIIGDDDFIINGGIEYVVGFLEKNRVSVLTVNTDQFVSVDDVMVKRVDLPNEKLIYFSHSHNDFFQKGFCVGVLCTIIFNRNLWLGADRNKYSKGWSYYEITLKIIAQSGLAMAHMDYALAISRKDCEWVKNGAELLTFIGWKKILEKLISYGYDRQHINGLLSGFPEKLIIVLLRAKGHDLNCSMDNLKLIIREFKHYPLHLTLAVMIFFVPNGLIKKIRDFKKILII